MPKKLGGFHLWHWDYQAKFVATHVSGVWTMVNWGSFLWVGMLLTGVWDPGGAIAALGTDKASADGADGTPGRALCTDGFVWKSGRPANRITARVFHGFSGSPSFFTMTLATLVYSLFLNRPCGSGYGFWTLGYPKTKTTIGLPLYMIKSIGFFIRFLRLARFSLENGWFIFDVSRNGSWVLSHMLVTTLGRSKLRAINDLGCFAKWVSWCGLSVEDPHSLRLHTFHSFLSPSFFFGTRPNDFLGSTLIPFYWNLGDDLLGLLLSVHLQVGHLGISYIQLPGSYLPT